MSSLMIENNMSGILTENIHLIFDCIITVLKLQSVFELDKKKLANEVGNFSNHVANKILT